MRAIVVNIRLSFWGKEEGFEDEKGWPTVRGCECSVGMEENGVGELV